MIKSNMKKTRKNKKGGSGIKLTQSFINKLIKAKNTFNKTKRITNYKNYKAIKKINTQMNKHPELTNENVENVKTLNISGPEWNIQQGNKKENIPINLLPSKKVVSVRELAPGVRVFQTR